MNPLQTLDLCCSLKSFSFLICLFAFIAQNITSFKIHFFLITLLNFHMAGYFVDLDCIITNRQKHHERSILNTTVNSYIAVLKCLFFFPTSEDQRIPTDVLFFQSPLFHSLIFGIHYSTAGSSFLFHLIPNIIIQYHCTFCAG